MKRSVRSLGCLFLMFALAGCTASSGSPAHDPDMQLKLYKVPVQQSSQIEGALGVVLAKEGKNRMGISQPFPGTLMVLAPANLQPSIKDAVDQLTKDSGRVHGSVPLRVRFWVVQAKAGAGDDAAALKPLHDTLQEIRGSLGPSHFGLEDTASALVDAPTHSDAAAGNAGMTTARGHKLSFHATASTAGKVTLQMQYADVHATSGEMDYSIPNLHTTITVNPGDYLVLAQAPPPASQQKNMPDATLMNLLVVRVDRIQTPAH